MKLLENSFLSPAVSKTSRRSFVSLLPVLASGALLIGCGGGDNSIDGSALPTSKSSIYVGLMAMRHGMKSGEVIALVGRAPESISATGVMSWTENGETLTISYYAPAGAVPQIWLANWQWSPTSKTAKYQFFAEGGPVFTATS